MKKAVKRGIAAALVVAAAGGVGVYATMPEAVAVETVHAGNVRMSVSEMGKIAADDPVTVYAPVAGRLSELRFQVNDSVSAGDVLAEYDLATLENSLEMARINTAYHEDGFAAASAQNNKNIAKANAASKEADALKQQYIATEENRDNISIAQNKEDRQIQSAMNGIQAELNNMETNLALETSRLDAAQSGEGDADAAVAQANAELSQLNKRISSSEGLIKTYQDHLATLEEGSDEYNTYMDLIAKEYETLTSLQNEKSGKTAERNALRSTASSASSHKDDRQEDVDRLKGKITESRNALASLPVSGMTTEEYARYAELTRQLDLIEREWEQNLDKKSAAEDKIVDQAQIRQYEDSAERARAEEKQAEVNLEKGRNGVKAGFAGTVTKRLVDGGAMVEAGTPLYELQPATGYKATAMISRYDIDSIQKGQRAEVTVGSSVYEGQVSAIAAVAETDSTGKPKVKVEIELKDPEVKPIIGLEAEVRIYPEERQNSLTVPEKAVYTDDEGSYVYVMKQGRVEKRSVTQGIKGDGVAEILSGLSDGETVITSALTDDRVGARVRPQG